MWKGKCHGQDRKKRVVWLDVSGTGEMGKWAEGEEGNWAKSSRL